MSRNGTWSVFAGLVPAALSVAAGCGNTQLASLFLPPGDNQAACRTISPGNEITARVAFRGRTVKLLWAISQCTLDKRGNVETLTLVAAAPDDGFVSGDKDAKLTLHVSREGGLALSTKYNDAPLISGQQPEHFDTAVSSTSVNAISLQTGGGSASVTEFTRAGTRLTIRVAFTEPLLNLIGNSIETICGEAFFDGPVTLTGG